MINTYFIAIVLPSEKHKILEDILTKYNPFYKFIPLHIQLTEVFESPLNIKELKESLKEDLEKFNSFNLLFKGLTTRQRNTCLKLVDGDKYIKSLRTLLHSKKILKNKSYLHLNNHPLIAKSKSPNRIRPLIRIDTILTFKFYIDAIYFIEAKPNHTTNLDNFVKLV